MAAVSFAVRAPAVAPLSVEEVRGTTAFASLRDEWNATLAEGPADQPFARHEWIDAWLERHASDVREGQSGGGTGGAS